MRREWYKTARYFLWGSALAYLAVLVAGYIMGRGTWYDVCYWITQSACIGAVADYVAVEALFRKPFGIPWHTRLLPRQRALISRQFEEAVQQWLQPEVIVARLRAWKGMDWVAARYETEEGRQRVRQVLTVLLWETYPHWPIATVLESLQAQVADYDIANWITKQPLPQETVQTLVPVLATWLQSEAVYRWIYDRVQDTVEEKMGHGVLYNIFSLCNVVDEHEMARDLQATLVAWIEDEDSGLYEGVQQAWQHFQQEVQPGGELATSCQHVWHAYTMEAPMHDLWRQYGDPWIRSWLAPNAQQESAAGKLLERGLYQVWLECKTYPAFQQAVQKLLEAVARFFVSSFPEVVPAIVRRVLGQFDEAAFTYFVEEKIASDLNWIRVNGAVVGGIIGAFVWLVLQGYDVLLEKILGI